MAVLDRRECCGRAGLASQKDSDNNGEVACKTLNNQTGNLGKDAQLSWYHVKKEDQHTKVIVTKHCYSRLNHNPTRLADDWL